MNRNGNQINKGKMSARLVRYFLGLFIITQGVAISVISGLGVTPLSSIPYTVTVISGMDLGLATAITSVIFVLVQVLILRSKFRPINWLQVPISAVFGAFLSSAGKLMGFIPNPASLLIAIIYILISTVVIAVGVYLYLSAEIMPLPPEGMVLAICRRTGAEFPKVKVIVDVSMVSASLATCLIVIHSLGSIGLGTVISAVLIGTEVKILTKCITAIRKKRGKPKQ